MRDEATHHTAGEVPPPEREVGPLVPCPMCGSLRGYALKDGSTYRWWDVFCVNCGRTVDECASDRRTQLGTGLPDRWPAADAAWNAAGEHAQKLRIGFERYETARRMSPRQWADAWTLSISTGKGFDEIVDDLRPFLRT